VAHGTTPGLFHPAGSGERRRRFLKSQGSPWLGKLDCYDLDNDNRRQKLLNDLRTTPHVRPIPHNVESPAHYVRREHEVQQLVRMLMAAPAGDRVAITTALRGAGGFGKTTVAKAVCFEDEVLARYTDGVLWLSVGEGTRDVSELLASLLSQIGQVPKSSDRDPLFGEWKEALRTRQCLIVLDDVWRESDAQSLVVRETSSAFLITTRIPRVASAVDASDCLVDAMTPEQSIALLAAALVDGHALDRSLEDRLRNLADRAGFWPVLLGLMVGQLRLTLRRPGASAAVAIKQVEEDLQDLGLTAFDRNDPNQRSAAVASTVEASLRYLIATDPEAQSRYDELAVFPDDVAIPLETLQDLWALSPSATRRLAERFDDSGLATLHFERGLNVHDVFLHYPARETEAR
jgi:NB-ARC domain